MGHIGYQEHPMTVKLFPRPGPASRDPKSKSVEMTAFLTLRRFSEDELERASRALASEGLYDLWPTRVVLATDDAEAVAAGRERVVPASLAPFDGALNPARSGSLDVPLDRALAAARTRGRIEKERMLADSSMLNTAAIANLLGMSEEGVRQKRKRHEVLGLELAKRGIRYPAWQVLEGRQLLPALPQLFDILGDDPWRLFRFLQQHHGELGGDRALDALRSGHVDGVIAAAENTAAGAYS
jgi:hypothetical protein